MSDGFTCRGHRLVGFFLVHREDSMSAADGNPMPSPARRPPVNFYGFAVASFSTISTACSNGRSTNSLVGFFPLPLAAAEENRSAPGTREARQRFCSSAARSTLPRGSGDTPQSALAPALGGRWMFLPLGRQSSPWSVSAPAIFFHIDELLDGSFAVAALADDDRAMVILQAGGNDLGGAGTLLVDQHGHGEIGESPLAAGQVGATDAAVAAAGGDDHTGVDEQIADVDGGIEVSARIVAQVEHQAPHVVLGQPIQGASNSPAVASVKLLMRT